MKITRSCLALACIATCAGVLAHETETPKAQLVWRDRGHYTLTAHVDLARALHLTLDPQTPSAKFLAAAAAMAPRDFSAAWERALAQWGRECALEQGGARVAAARWRWPTAAEAQALLRERLMHGLTAGDPEHTGPLAQVQAEFRTETRDRAAARLHLPTAFKPLSLTTYRPQQRWVGPGDGPVPLSFISVPEARVHP